MRFGILDAKQRSATMADFADAPAAMLGAGLKPGEVDFGVISRHTHIIVYEYGLFAPKESQYYFAINGALYAGNAVIFSNNDEGDTVDLTGLPPITWLKDADAVERAIERGDVARPEMSVNGTVLWQWPQPRQFA